MTELSVEAPATIANFGPGFDIFGVALDQPTDRITVRLRDDDTIRVYVRDNGWRVPSDVDANTAGVAAREFLKRIRADVGVDVYVEKGITPGVGLGSSGASAAGVVYALAKLLVNWLDYGLMIEAAGVGEVASAGVAHLDNVAASLLGGFVFIRNQRPVQVMRMDVPPIPLVICTPSLDLGNRKTQLTRSLLPKSLELNLVVEQMAYTASVIAAIKNGSLEEIGRAINRDNISEPTRSKIIPGYSEIKRRVLEAGAYGCNICGGGPSVFAVCEEDLAEEIGLLMVEAFRRLGVESTLTITQASNVGVREA